MADLQAAMDRLNPHDCDCAATPPTIPLYRDPHDHLSDCPMGRWIVGQAGLAWAREVLKDPAKREQLAADMARESFIADHGQEAYDQLREAFGEGEDG